MKYHFFSASTLNFKVLLNKWIKLRNVWIETIAVKLMFPVVKLFQRKTKGGLQLEVLKAYPRGTFGKELADHMVAHQIDFLPVLEDHDMKHLLLDFPLTVAGEMRLSAFEFGSGNHSPQIAGVFFPAFIVAPEMWKELLDEFRRGKRNRHVRQIPLKDMLEEPIEKVKEKLQLQ